MPSPVVTEPPTATSSLLMVGVVHLDPKGFGKAFEFFRRHQPDLIMVELSPFGCWFRKQRRKQFRKALQKNLKKAVRSHGIPLSRAHRHPAIRNIVLQLALPFEYRAAVRYARANGATIALVDSSRFSRYWIGFWPELISADNLQNLLASPTASPSVRSLYRLAQNSLPNQPDCSHLKAPLQAGRCDNRWAKREHYLAGRIHHTIARRRPQKPVYIGGWRHLTVNACSPTLRQILHLESSQCHLLTDAQQFSLRHS